MGINRFGNVSDLLCVCDNILIFDKYCVNTSQPTNDHLSKQMFDLRLCDCWGLFVRAFA